MRHLVAFVVFWIVVFPAGAAKRSTVAQLEQVLTSAYSAHKSDANVARQIASFELSEQLTETTLEQLTKKLGAGPQSRLSLRLLADQSSFLEPPASELPTTTAPDAATQQKMLNDTRSYAAQVLPRLPNFLAMRTINRYDDSPYVVKKDEWPVRAGLHLVDNSSREVSVNDERENQPPTQGSAIWQQQIGLISGGEFGTTLGMVLTDSMQGNIAWSHWEQLGESTLAVFRYSVPKTASHFELISTLQREASIEGFASAGGGRIAGIETRPNNNPSRTSILHTKPAYHGSILVDPETGTVLKITIEAELKESDPFRSAAILVRYGSVQIGDGKFICPIRSLALSKAATDTRPSSDSAPTEWLNETLFLGYHRFGSSIRVIPATAGH